MRALRDPRGPARQGRASNSCGNFDFGSARCAYQARAVGYASLLSGAMFWPTAIGQQVVLFLVSVHEHCPTRCCERRETLA